MSKYTVCPCCGYQILPDIFMDEEGNKLSQTCPICSWRESYHMGDNEYWKKCYVEMDNLFEIYCDGIVQVALYRAQENYKKSRYYARKPYSYEKKDPAWCSIQDIVENNYSVAQLVSETHKCCARLKDKGRVYSCQSHEEFDEFSLGEEETVQALKLESLSAALYHKKNSEQLLTLFEEYYLKGLSYHIPWLIILLSFINLKQITLNARVIDILVDIEINNYYGMSSLKTALDQYWHNYHNK